MGFTSDVLPLNGKGIPHFACLRAFLTNVLSWKQVFMNKERNNMYWFLDGSTDALVSYKGVVKFN